VAAGTGSQLLLYEVGSARLVASFRVFDGVRVHGIEPRSGGPDSYTLAVFGERRVKLFSLGFGVEADGGEVGEARLELEQRLPGFDHWVLDARFLEVPRLVRTLIVESGVELFVFTNLATTPVQVDGLLAIGLSDNSVTLWDLSKCALVTRVKSPGLMTMHLRANFGPIDMTCAKFPVHVCLQNCLLGAEKCLLYSMRMWGDSVRELLVASGTILNEVNFPSCFCFSSSLTV